VNKQVKVFMVFGNGNIAAFDKNEKQIPQLQKFTVFELLGWFASQHGFSTDGCEYRSAFYWEQPVKEAESEH
jgi:hypothetical protein